MLQSGKLQIANVNRKGEKAKVEALRQIFKARNPGYDMVYYSGVRQLHPQNGTQVAFVHQIDGATHHDAPAKAVIKNNQGSEIQSEAGVGDILIRHSGERIHFDAGMGLLVFTVPEEPEQHLPSFIRPDHDPNIPNAPGGCATGNDAYRRILLTWREDVGAYVYHAINTHRVRIYDSLTHFHPVEGGFDEFYLVQSVNPGARLLTSEKGDLITAPEQIGRSQVDTLLDEHDLDVGDLVYLPRGVVHRGIGGALAQVISIPGFIPGSEIGVDHHLKAINEQFELNENEALPYNEEHSHEAVIQ